jgi:hypothetical protein
MTEQSLFDLIRTKISWRRAGRVLLAAAGLYLLGTGTYSGLLGAGGFPVFRVVLGAAALIAAFCLRMPMEEENKLAGHIVTKADSPPERTRLGILHRHFANGNRWAAVPAAFLLAIVGSWCFQKFVALVWPGMLLSATALFLFIRSLRREGIGLPSGPRETVPGEGDVKPPVRWKAAAAAAGLSAATFMTLSENRFTFTGGTLWAIGVAAWVAALWEGPICPPLRKPAAFLTRWLREGMRFCLKPKHLLVLGMIAMVAVFRFAALDSVPGEMTSDHVEDLLVVNRILSDGDRPIFEPGVGGRETLGFYITALAVHVSPAALTHSTLKILGALEGLVALFFIFLLAREITDDRVGGFFAMFLAGIAWWPNVLGRLGTHATLGTCFSALALWLMIRALNRGSRNAALLSGLVTGVGLYGHTSAWVVPVACTMALLLYGVSGRDIHAGRRAAAYWVISTIAALAVFVPMLRYHLDHRHDLAFRIGGRVYGGLGNETPLPMGRLLRNVWNSLSMFHWSSDGAWIASPPGQPAVDWITAALLILGMGFLVFRYWRFRDWLDLFLPLSVPVLLLPSTLALAFGGRENPSLQRSSAAVPIVFAVAGLALLVLLDEWRRTGLHLPEGLAGLSIAAIALSASALANWQIVFGDYARNYSRAAQNASGIGRVVGNFAESVGSYETAFVKSYPHWADVRAVGIYAGKFGWEQSICDTCRFRDVQGMRNDPRARLFIVHPQDLAFAAALRETFPEGSLSEFEAPEPRHSFLVFFVPGRPGIEDRHRMLR